MIRTIAASLAITLFGVLIALLVIGWIAYARDMGHAYARIEGRSTVIASRFGDIEYLEGGVGTPVLVVHGSGGGYDQGELLAQAVLGEGHRWIAPSRFGYLRSSFHEGAGFEDQARAYAFLLDRLGVRRVAVVALSHGGPSALLFAALYPERVSSLTLISCGVASSSSEGQAQADRKGEALVRIFRHDLLYWATATLFRTQLVRLMGADAALLAELSPPQRALVARVIDEMHPVEPRAAGAAFDNRAAMPNERIAAIRAPSLILHARDDSLQLFRHAEFAAARIPGARLEAFDRGGHLLLAVEQPRIRESVQRFIETHVAGQDLRGG